MQILNCTFKNNISTESFGGGIFYLSSDADAPGLLIQDSSFIGNSAQQGGGGGVFYDNISPTTNETVY
jgi:hypothetical protein